MAILMLNSHLVKTLEKEYTDLHIWFTFKKTKDKIPKYGGPDELECSHLCGNKCCINAEHLVFEKHDVNQERIHCQNQGMCCKSHRPFCII